MACGLFMAFDLFLEGSMNKSVHKYAQELKSSNAKVTKYGMIYKERSQQLSSPAVKRQNQAVQRIKLKKASAA